MVVVLDGVLDLHEGILRVVHAEGDAVQQVRVQHVQRGVAQREAAAVVTPDARGSLMRGGSATRSPSCFPSITIFDRKRA